MHIKKVKTLQGLRYAVVESFTSTTKNGKGEMVTTTRDYPVEYVEGEVKYHKGDNIKLAIFPVTAEGLAKAKEVQKSLKKKK